MKPVSKWRQLHLPFLQRVWQSNAAMGLMPPHAQPLNLHLRQVKPHSAHVDRMLRLYYLRVVLIWFRTRAQLHLPPTHNCLREMSMVREQH
jgi:hypothetical protein